MHSDVVIGNKRWCNYEGLGPPCDDDIDASIISAADGIDGKDGDGGGSADGDDADEDVCSTAVWQW